MLDKFLPQKIDGALGAMIIEDQPTHSIYLCNIAKLAQNVNGKVKG